MGEVRIAELERAVAFARGVAAPLAEVLSRKGTATVLVESPQAERIGTHELASGLVGPCWIVPVEIGGVRHGVMCVVIPRQLVPEPAGLVLCADDFLAEAANRLTAAEGGVVSLDRLGLRETSPATASAVLSEVLGPSECVAVRFAARYASGGGLGEVVIAFGGGFIRELTAAVSAFTKECQTVAVPKDFAGRRDSSPGAIGPETPMEVLLDRARGLRMRISAELGRKSFELGELARLGPGSSIDIGKSATEPLELRVCGRLIAFADAIVSGGKLGVRVRGTPGRVGPGPASSPTKQPLCDQK